MRECANIPGVGSGRDFDHAVAAVVQDIPQGVVVSYGWIAQEAGFPGAARAVGRLLGQSPAPLPWWRVTRADGRFAPPVARRQAEMLRAEGVPVTGGRTTTRPLRPSAGGKSGDDDPRRDVPAADPALRSQAVANRQRGNSLRR